MRRLLVAVLTLLLPAAAWAEEAAGSPSPAPSSAPAASERPETKHDVGTVRTVDPEHGLLLCDMSDGTVTYDVSTAQAIDSEGKPIGAAASALKPGQKVRLDYVVQNGAKVREVRLLK